MDNKVMINKDTNDFMYLLADIQQTITSMQKEILRDEANIDVNRVKELEKIRWEIGDLHLGIDKPLDNN